MASCGDRTPRRRPTFEQLDRVLRAATAQLSEGAAKLLPPSRIPPDLLGEAEAEAEASDGPEPDAAVDAALVFTDEVMSGSQTERVWVSVSFFSKKLVLQQILN